MSYVEKIEATTKQIDAKLGALSYTDFGETVNETNKNALDYFNKNTESIITAIHADRKESVEAQIEQLKKLETIGKDMLKALTVIKNPYDNFDFDKEIRRSDIGEAQNKYRRNIKGRMDTWDEKWDKTVAVNAMERGSDSGWNWWKNRISSIWQGFTNSNADLDERARATGYIDENGKPVAIDEKTLKPIHDGAVSIAKSDPKDSAIFAKTGGPFDTLFNGVFDKINEVYGMFSDGMEHNKELSVPFLLPVPTVHDNVLPLSSNDDRNNTMKPSYTPTSQPFQGNSIGKGQFDVTVRGEINLKANGQTVDILRQLQEDPTLVRAITQMISESIASQKHGGKSPYGGYRW